MKITCEIHGEIEAEPNANYDVFCPKCCYDEYKKLISIDGARIKIHTDKFGYPIYSFI